MTADEARAGARAEPAEGAGAAEAPPPPPRETLLLVNAADPEEVRIALLEDGHVEELYVEATEEPSAAGNVYRGRVQNVEKGIGAAFVDLGGGLTGFLHVSDLPDRPPEGSTIADVLAPGQEVVVQITRDSLGRKGPAVTARVALPGRYVVLLVNSPGSGVSRRISRGQPRERVRRLLAKLEMPEGMGVIVRTAGEDVTQDDLERDLRHLLAAWARLQQDAARPGPPGLLLPESDLAERSVRDIMPAATTRIVVDRDEVAERIRTRLGTWYALHPAEPASGERSAPEVVLHDDPLPLFHAYEVEGQLEEAYRRVLRLPSGGSIVIDPTEALVAIDVNSGRHTAEEDPESTALRTNLEAAAMVARQLRLRDLGGQVVVDLIDMRDRSAARQVEKTLKAALARDRARIRVGRVDSFGCLILSRQRIRPALSHLTRVACEGCGGTGRRRAPSGLALRVLREMQARAARARGRGGLEARVPPPVHDWIRRHRLHVLRRLEEDCSGPVRLEADDRLPPDGWAMKGLPPAARHRRAKR